ncbi:MAG TPA: protein translocase subunit SecD [Chthoniobacterales bacterium]|nr:protein translocase subunit SecD [Chthoniobacterales bacterium]
MSPALTFLIGMAMLILFGWYFATEIGPRKRILGTLLTVLLTAFCVWAMLPLEKKIRLGLDLKGGTSFLIKLSSESGREISKELLDQAVEVIRKRVDEYGVGEPVISPAGTDRILVQIPGLDSEKIQEARQQLSRVAKLEFRLVYPDNGQRLQGIDAGSEVIPPEYKVETYTMHAEGAKKAEEERLLVKKKADLGGDRVTESNAYYGNEGWTVQLKFDGEGAKQFGTITEKFKGFRFAIVLDGVIQSAPVIRDAIYGGDAVITGRFTEQEARGLASVLENPLQTPVTIEEQRSASASLGQDSIKSGVYAGLVGLALIFAAVLFYYRLAGLVALVALAVEGVLLFGFLAMFGAVLTLPGIAGIILSLGMAIDANVLIYERLREEVAVGKSLKHALDDSYRKAFSAIFDSHVTTLITAAILYFLATGPVRGFAVTLTIGIIASMFTALIITRNLFSWLFHFNLLRKITMANLIAETNIDFLGKRRIAMIASGLLIIALGAVFAMRGANNFGVDFRGGDRLVLEAQGEKVSEAQVRDAIAELNITDVVVQKESSATADFITIRSPLDSGQQIDAHVKTKLPQAQFRTEASDKVGSLVGQELIRTSLAALGLGLLGILIYVAMRFELSFAIGAIVALLHDLLITIGLYSLAGREISLIFVGAVLTIAGYSVNDKIVVFDRIREGLRSERKGSVQAIMNRAINETLSRTLLTGGTTLLALGALYFLGGPVLNDFAFSIFVGVVVGTFSSIYTAAPIVLWWSRLKGKSLHREVKKSDSAIPALESRS